MILLTSYVYMHTYSTYVCDWIWENLPSMHNYELRILILNYLKYCISVRITEACLLVKWLLPITNQFMTLDMIISIKHLNWVRTTKLKISVGKYRTRYQRKINAQLAELLVDEPSLSLTTDIRSSSSAQESLISFDRPLGYSRVLIEHWLYFMHTDLKGLILVSRSCGSASSLIWTQIKQDIFVASATNLPS